YTPGEGRYAGRLKMQFFDGSDNQPVSSLARQTGSEWNFRLPGISYGVFQFQLFNEEFGDLYKKAYKNPYNGLPQIKVVTDGRNVPDIVSRPQAEDTIATDQWNTVFASGYQHQGVHSDYEAGFAPTTNPVHHLLDYMLNSYYGAGIPLAKFDKDSWVKAAQVCRVYRNYTSKTGLTGLFGGFFTVLEKLFKPTQGGFIDQQDGIIYNAIRFFLKPTTSDGQVYPGRPESGKVAFINTPYNRQFKIYPNRSYLDNINLMLRSMGAIMTYVNGKFRIIMENGGNQQNSFDIPSVATLKSQCDGDGRTFTDDDIVGNISLKGATLENTFNQVKVNYPDFEDKSKSNSQVYPDKGSTLYASLLEEDNNQELTAEITNTGIFMPRDALVYAKVTLEKSRNRETISFQTPDSNANIIPGDIIRVNSSYGGFDNLYRVTDVLL
ncbi:MAG: phage tail protein, partial [Candidatus Poseidoniales archaeon]